MSAQITRFADEGRRTARSDVRTDRQTIYRVVVEFRQTGRSTKQKMFTSLIQQ